jgi:predicted nucleic acid-binding protein
MRSLVADASALLAPALGEPGSRTVRRLAEERRQSGAPLLVPQHFWLEVVNVLTRRHGLGGAVVLEALHDLDRLGLETRELGRAMAIPILDAVERHRLTAYDAAYLVLADATDADLLTADRELARAAGERALWVGPKGRISEPPAPYDVTPTWPSWRGAAAYLGELRRQEATSGPS